MINWIARISFTKPLNHIKTLFQSHKKHRDLIRELIHSVRSYHVLCALGFCIQVLLDLQGSSRSSMFFEVKKFATSNNQSVVGS